MDLIGLIAVIGAFSIGPTIVYLRGRHKLEERKLELEARRGGGNRDDTKQLTEENKLLRERVENLESIVCSVDFELNQKLARMIDEQRSLLLPAGAGAASSPTPSPSSPSSPAAGAARPTGRNTSGGLPALENTATAQARATPISTTIEPGQVLAQRYRIQ